MAVLGDPNKVDAGELDITAGYGAHPNAGRAAVRAITEAAQSRVTAIAASRDDIHTASFDQAAAASSRNLLEALPASAAPSDIDRAEFGLDAVLDRLRSAKCRIFTAVLSAPDAPFCVVRTISPDLEDRGANLNWRPGWRSFDALERLQWI
jgi:ribosomal protein S12 methylthiotransferase accessory factor